MITETVIVKNELGVHARTAAKISKLSSQFSSKLFLEKKYSKINCNNMLEIMLMGATKGTELKIIAEGDDELIAIKELKTFFDNNCEE